MKLKKIFLIALTSLSLISCGNNSNENKKITYGTFAHTESIELKILLNILSFFYKKRFVLLSY